jgi:hypothetical protein
LFSRELIAVRSNTDPLTSWPDRRSLAMQI